MWRVVHNDDYRGRSPERNLPLSSNLPFLIPRILSRWTPPPVEQQRRSWEGVVTITRPRTLDIRDAMRYTLSLPVSTVIIGCDDIPQLEENVQIAREFTPLSQSQMAALGNQVAPVARQSLFFHFETRPRDTNLSDSG